MPIEPPSFQRSIRTISFDAAAVTEIAALFGTIPYPAGFELRGMPILRIDIASSLGRNPTTLTFWPSLRRVDAISESVVVVFTNIATVDLVEGVEVLFRRKSGEYLIVAIGGKVIVRS